MKFTRVPISKLFVWLLLLVGCIALTSCSTALSTPPYKPTSSFPTRSNRPKEPESNVNYVELKPTARCRDGSLSYSQSRQGTCSHHGGVSTWESRSR